ncbi:NUDIX hydrolase [Caulobacter sp. KR2-114]|uniref:NUDIX hydrolase n=1 Tax=Caulobacter sp. KR2-114 TaxID=3400912 RepID=UPI003C034CEB
MSFRLAAYAVCIEANRALLVHHRSGSWTLPGGRVEHGEDPLDTVRREVLEETGCAVAVERLLGIDSRLIPAAERAVPGGEDHQNVGIFYQGRLLTGDLRPEANGDIVEIAWTALPRVASLRRSSLVDVGLALAATLPADGHVAVVPVGGLIQH